MCVLTISIRLVALTITIAYDAISSSWRSWFSLFRHLVSRNHHLGEAHRFVWDGIRQRPG